MAQPCQDRIVPFLQPKFEHERRALQTLREVLDNAPEIGDYRLFVRYYIAPPGRGSEEVDALLLCRYGAVIIELKDHVGTIEIPDLVHPPVRILPGRRDQFDDNPVPRLRDRCRDILTVLANNGLRDWRVLGLLLFTHPNVQLRIGPTSEARIASGEVGIGRPEDVPWLLPRVARHFAGGGRQPRSFSDQQILRACQVLSRGPKGAKDRFPFSIGSYVVEAPVAPFEEIAAQTPVDYRLYRGREEDTDVPVLVKEIRVDGAQWLDDPEGARAALTHAAAALRTLSQQHPNIVELLTFVDSDNRETVYHIYRLEPSATPLYHWIQAPLRQRLDLLAQAARALAFVHEHDMLHRAVNPFNILVTGDGRTAKLFNFDFARVRPKPTRMYAAQRQPLIRYVAKDLRFATKPEEVTWRCDSFSFGATAFEVLSGGQFPFEDADNHGNQRELLDYVDLSGELDQLITSALSVRPDERPQLVDLAKALEREAERHAEEER